MISVLYLSKGELELQFANIGKLSDIIVYDYDFWNYRFLKNNIDKNFIGRNINRQYFSEWLDNHTV
jgi:hypothetical protein